METNPSANPKAQHPEAEVTRTSMGKALYVASLTVFLEPLACVAPPPHVAQPNSQARPQGAAPELVQRPNAQGLFQERRSNDGSPSSFVKVLPNAWETVQYRSGLSAREVHDRVYSVVRNIGFDISEIQPNDYMGRSHWNHTYASKGVHRSEYRTRIQWKVFSDERVLRFRVEAQFNPGGGGWIDGFDADAMKDLRDDLDLRLR